MCVTKLLSLRPPPACILFCSKKEFFFPFRPTVYKHPVTDNASFQNALQRGDFWKRRKLLDHTWTDENGLFSITVISEAD